MKTTAFAALRICATVSLVTTVHGQPTPTRTCEELPYPPPTPHISLSVAPTPPLLGSPVTFSFQVFTYPSGPPNSVAISGAAPVFEVNGQQVASYFFGADVVCSAVAVQAGTALLVLSFDSEIAYGCIDHPIYSFRHFSSEPFAVEVIGPTPTATSSPTPTAIGCVGDCNSDVEVTVDEIITGVNMALGNVGIDACPAFMCCAGEVCALDVSCIVGALDNALNGCPVVRATAPTASPTP